MMWPGRPDVNKIPRPSKLAGGLRPRVAADEEGFVLRHEGRALKSFDLFPFALSRARRRRAGRDDPEFGRAALAVAAVHGDEARGVDAARLAEVVARAGGAALALAGLRAPPAVGDDVPLGAGVVLEFDGEV